MANKNSDETNEILRSIASSLRASEANTRQERFQNILKQQGLILGNPKTLKARPKSADTNQLNSLLKMVIGMALGGYGHDPSKKKNTTAAEIHSDLALQGISLDEDTIRKWLKEAEKFLPDNRD